MKPDFFDGVRSLKSGKLRNFLPAVILVPYPYPPLPLLLNLRLLPPFFSFCSSRKLPPIVITSQHDAHVGADTLQKLFSDAVLEAHGHTGSRPGTMGRRT